MTAIARKFSLFALAAALASCQCGEREGRGGAEAPGPAPGAEEGGDLPAEGRHRILVTPSELRLDGDTVGDTRALARDPSGGSVEGLAKALEARAGRSGPKEGVLLEAEAGAPAAVLRRAAATARAAGIREVAFALAGAEAGRSLQLDPPGEEAPILTVEVAPGELRVKDRAGKTWTLPEDGSRGGRKVLIDVLRARKESPDLRDRDDLEVIVHGGTRYGALFEVLDAAAASGFERPRLAPPAAGSGAGAGNAGKAR